MKLKQVANISAGYPFRGRIPETANSFVRVIQMKDIAQDTGIHWEGSIKTILAGKGKPDWLMPNDILFAARGIHNYAVLVDQHAHNISSVAAPHFYIIRCISDQILPGYLVWLLNQYPCQRYYQREAEGTLTKSIRRSVLEDTPIAIPTLAKQRHVIQLVNTLKQQQRLMQQLIDNNKILMSRLATNLLTNPSH